MGWKASDTRPLTFEDCIVPEGDILGERGDGFVQTCLGQTDGESRNGNPTPVQYLHELFEAVPALTEDVAFGHNAILEGQRARIRGLPSHFLVGVANDIARGTLWHDNIRDLVVPIGALTSNGGDSETTRDC